jgi:hypothetical protein
MKLSTRIVALALIVAAAAPVRAQISASVDSAQSTRSSMSIVPPLVATDASVLANAKRATDANPSTSLQSDFSTTGAPLTGLRAGVHARETPRPLQPTAAPAHANLGQARAMMVVGVAGLIAGAIIGGSPGTIVMVGGAVVGLFGLYDYLQ